MELHCNGGRGLQLTPCREAPPEDFPFLAVNNNHAPPPAAASFRPAVKVLSRKPTPQMIARKDPATGLEQLTLQDDDVEEEVKEQESLEERKARQQKELEEKQRRYEEARAKIFGETKSNPPSGQSTPGNVTPPLSVEGGRGNYRGRGRGRGGPRGGNHNRNESQEKRPSTQTNPRELFDPGYSQKPGFSLQKRTETGSPQPGRSTTPRHEEQVIRAPRGPDGSGRGGFGFAKRGSPDG